MKKQLLASIGAILFSASVAFGQNCANDVTAPTPGDASGNAASVQTTYTSQNPLEIQLGSTGTAGFGVGQGQYDAATETGAQLFLPAANSASGNKLIFTTATDNCSTSNFPSISASQSSFDCSDIGAPFQIIIYYADASSNIVQASMYVEVTETVAPVLTVGDITLTLDANGSATLANHGSATDNCDTDVDITYSQTAFDCSHLGENSIVVTAEDDAGNQDQVTISVLIEDVTAPIITAPSAVTLVLDGNGSASLDLSTISAADNCETSPTISYSRSTTYGCSDVGTSQITVTATDGQNPANTSTHVIDVTVEDNTDPTLTAPADVTVNVDAGECSAAAANVTLGNPTAADNCSVTTSNDAPSSYPVGTTTVTWTAVDPSGNDVTATQTVTVVDNIDPTITAPAAVTVNCDAGACSAAAANVTLGSATTADNCSVASTTNDAPNSFPVGTTTVTWTVTDASGRTATATQDVTVVDNIDPTITAPANVTVNVDAGQCDADAANVTLGNATTADNCGIQSTTNDAPNTYPVGTTTVTWTVEDVNGRTATATQTVTVVDNIDPTLTAPADVTVNVDAGECSAAAANVTLGNPTAADNCSVTTSNDAPSSYPVGTTTVTWTAVDPSGNDVTATQTVTVVDNIDPTITAPAAVTVNCDAGACSAAAANVTLGSATTADNCSVASTTNDAPNSFPVGTTTVTWTVTDASGRTATATQDVTVVDNIDPTITAPANVTVNVDAGQCDADAANVTLGNATTADNCGIQSTTNDAPNTYPVGTTTVTWTVTDVNGRTATATQTVTVVDNIDPTLTAPADVTVNVDAGECSAAAANVTLGNPTAADNCSVTTSNDAPSSYPVGTTTVTWTAVDPSGNDVTATQTVTVVDNIDPTITAPAAVTVNCDAGACSAAAANVTLGSATTADNCSVASTTNDAPNSFPVGTTTVTWTVTDASGRTATATQDVTVVDNIDPTITAPANVTVNVDAGQCDADAANVTLGNATTADNCGIQSTTNDAPNTYPVGTTTVTWTVTDVNGRTATATQTVTVVDNIDPTLTAPADVTVNVDAGECSADAANVTLGNPTAADNCSVTTSNDAPSSYPVGTTTVTWTAVDPSGNDVTATQTVTVVDNIDPVLTVADVTIQLDANGNATLANHGSATDNCTANPTITYDVSSFTCAELGANTVVVTAADANGNSVNQSITVTVEDNIDPVLTVSDITLVLDANGNATLANHGSATDNCTTANITYSETSFDCNDLGANAVDVTATDGSGNAVTQEITVTIEDNTAPTVAGATVNVFLDANGSGTISDVTTLFATATDNTNCTLDYQASRLTFDCDDLDFDQSISNPSQADANNTANWGTTAVTITLTDAAGNASTATAQVRVIDNEKPTITAPSLDLDLNAQGFVSIANTMAQTLATVTADNCSLDASRGNINQSYFDCDDLGSNTVTAFVFDSYGNTRVTAMTVQINDVTAPVITTVAGTVTLNLDANGSRTVVLSDVFDSAVDNCTDGASLTNALSGAVTFDCSHAGTTQTITMTSEDASGNVSTATKQVEIVDNTNPTITLLNSFADINVGASGSVTIQPSHVVDATADNCSVSSVTISPNSFTCSDAGTTPTVTVTATDASGNVTTETATVNVVDATAPTIVAVSNIAPVDLDANGNASISLSDVMASVSDICDSNPNASISPSTFDCTNTGNNTVTITATDASNNTSTQTVTVVVQDVTDPTLSVPAANISANTSDDGTGDCTVDIAVGDATFADNCSADLSWVLTGATTGTGNGQVGTQTFEIGTTTITYTAEDPSGNDVTAVVTVEVADDEDPTVAAAANVTANTGDNDPGDCDAEIAITDATFSDNCTGAALTWAMTGATAATGSGQVGTYVFPIGTTTITYTVTDGSNNDATSQMTVTVTDDEDPTVSAAANIAANTSDDGAGNCDVDVAVPDATFADNCSGVSLAWAMTGAVTDNANGQVGTYTFPIGTTTITYTATDASNRTATSSLTVTVTDDEDPTVAASGNVTANTSDDGTGDCTVDIAITDATFADNCTGSSIAYAMTGATTVASTNGQVGTATFEIGTTTITYTVTDGANRTATSTMTVVVTDDEDPTLSVANNVTANTSDDGTGDCTVDIAITDATFADNCSGSALAYVMTGATTGSGNGQVGTASFTKGTTTITYTVTDGSNRTVTESMTVTVTDDEDPSITTVAGTVTLDLDANGSVTVVLSDVFDSASDNCTASGDIVTALDQTYTFDCDDVGVTQTISMTSEDEAGNTTTVTKDVEIADNIAPTASVVATYDVYLDASGAASVAFTDLDNGSSDNCSFTSTIQDNNFDCDDAGQTIEVTGTLEDPSGNTTNYSSDVTVHDTIAPVFATVQTAAVTLNSVNYDCFALAAWDAPTYNANDQNCSGTITTSYELVDASGSVSTVTLGNPVAVGTYTVRTVATDANGNVRKQGFTLNVVDNTDPTITFVANPSVDLDANGSATLTSSMLISSSYDNCGIDNITFSPSTVDCDDVASGATVAVTATDFNGNTATYNVTVAVNDVTAPSLSVIGSAYSVVLDASGAGSVSASDLASATDNCSATPSLSVSPSSFTCSDAGSVTVTITATDDAGNTSTATKTISVVDNAAPVITVSNTTLALDGNGVVTLPSATATAADNCTSTPNVTYSQTTFTCSDLGANTVTVTAADANGNVATQTFTVTVEDNIAPTVTMLSTFADVALDATGAASISINNLASNVSDNCGTPTLTITPSTFSCTDLGSNTVTVVATDASGNATTQQATITIVDNTAPSIATVSGAVTVTLDASGAATIATSDVVSSTSDNCTSAPTVSITPSAFGCADLGSNTVTITATDASGNVSTATKAVTVVDNAAPTIVASNTTITLDANGVAVLPNATASATDNCSAAPSIAYSQTTFTCADLGANTVTITATDASGNAATSTITVTVDDNIAPSITTLSTIADVALDANGAAAIGMNDVVSSVTDNCGAPTVTITPSSFGCGDLGTNTVTITATDASGNATTSQVTLTVVDNSAPTIATVSGTVTVALDANGAGAISQSDVVASVTDNCTATPTVTLSATSFDCSDLGSNTITITATDASGNVKTATKTVTVVDNTAPTITAPASITLTLGSSGAVSLPLSTASAADNCSGAPSLTYSATNFSCADVGSNTITITSVDASGNSSTTTMTVVVQDNTAPSLALSTAPVTLVLDANGSASLSTAQLVSSATDNCSSVTLSVSPSSFGCSDLGANTVTVTATDASGNTTTATASVTVADQTAPTIATVGSAVTVYLDANGSGSISTSDVVSSTTDNCTTAPTVSLSTTSFGCSDLGSNTVTITATDGSGNASTATKSVTVVDTISPTITAPASLTLTLGSGGTVNLPATTASATDNCSGSVTLSYSVTSFSCSDVGSNTVTVTATDANGNATTSTMTVTVQDNTAPTLALNTTTTTLALDASGSASLAAAQLVSSVSDNCSGVTISVSPSSFGCSDLGANTVTVTATDANGNSTTATTSVTVVDNIDPVVTTVAAPADVVLGANGTATITQAMVVASATDNCTTSPTITITPSTVDCSDLGSTTITILATDASGNVGMATVNVTVVDQDAPVIVSAPADTTLAACNAQLVYNYNVTDNCGYTANLVTGLASGSTFPVGTTTVTYEFSDASGNSVTHSFDVTVDTLGTYSLPANTEFCADNGPVDLSVGQAGLTYVGDGIAADGQTFQPAVAGVGLHTLSFTYTDPNGCVQVGSLSVRVYPVPAQPTVLQVLPTVLESSVTGARYQWFKNGVWMPGETSKQLNITMGGNYQVKVFNAYDCDRMSTGLVISSTGLSIDEVFSTLNIFPNPTQSVVALEFGVSLESDMTVQVMDIAGRTIYSNTITAGTQVYRIDLSQFMAGSYQMILRDNETGAASVEQIIKVD